MDPDANTCGQLAARNLAARPKEGQSSVFARDLNSRDLGCRRLVRPRLDLFPGQKPTEMVFPVLSRAAALSSTGHRQGYLTKLGIPANRSRLSSYRDTMESDLVQRQEWQIVQP